MSPEISAKIVTGLKELDMRHWAMGMKVLVIVLAAGFLVGCEDTQPPEETNMYDPNIDAPPSPLVAAPDSDLLADQARLARRSGRSSARSAGTSSGASSAGSDPRLTGVRATLSKMIDAAKDGDLASVADYAADKDAEALKSTLTKLADLKDAEDVLLAAIKAHAADVTPATVTQLLERGPDGGPFLARIGTMSVIDLAPVGVDANTVTVKERMGTQLTFAKVGDDWLISLSEAEVKVYAALGELAPLQITAAKALSEGLASGLIDPDSLPQAAMDKAATILDAVARLKEAMDAAKLAGGSEDSPTE